MTTPAWLPPDFRYASDGWVGLNALTYVVYQTLPVYAADGVSLVTPGVPRDLTGYTVSGTLRYRSCGRSTNPIGAPSPITMTGAIVDAPRGVISLSLDAASTTFPRQQMDEWGDPRRALLIAQPRVVDSNGVPVTVGLQPIFVF